MKGQIAYIYSDSNIWSLFKSCRLGRLFTVRVFPESLTNFTHWIRSCFSVSYTMQTFRQLSWLRSIPWSRTFSTVQRDKELVERLRKVVEG